MTHHLYTNPHSQHGLAEEGVGAAQAVQQARQLTLDMCHASAEDYDVIFTSGATGALRLCQSCRDREYSWLIHWTMLIS